MGMLLGLGSFQKSVSVDVKHEVFFSHICFFSRSMYVSSVTSAVGAALVFGTGSTG